MFQCISVQTLSVFPLLWVLCNSPFFCIILLCSMFSSVFNSGCGGRPGAPFSSGADSFIIFTDRLYKFMCKIRIKAPSRERGERGRYYRSDIFAALFFVLSLIAYRNIKTKRLLLLFISIVFALFSLKT
jgi:hypothetical protein